MFACIGCAGFSYERAAIVEWLDQHTTSPKTGEPLPNKMLTPNHTLRTVIQGIVNTLTPAHMQHGSYHELSGTMPLSSMPPSLISPSSLGTLESHP